VTKGRRVCLRRRAGERGQALVEMVIILPIFLLLVFGMIEFGRVFNYWIDMTHLANEGARYASVNRWPTCPGQSASSGACNPTTLKAYLVARANTGELRTQLNGADGVQVCYPEAGPLLPGKPVRVIINAHIAMPVLDSFLGLLGADGDLDMRSTSTMRLEWTPDRLDSVAEGMVTPCP
jgi:TadE-like protein